MTDFEVLEFLGQIDLHQVWQARDFLSDNRKIHDICQVDGDILIYWCPQFYDIKDCCTCSSLSAFAYWQKRTNAYLVKELFDV